MTSLAVIFILLFLAYVSNQNGKTIQTENDILAELKNELTPTSLPPENISRVGDAVVIVVPERLMNFESGSDVLKLEGRQFIDDDFPRIARILAQKKYVTAIDSVIVEGQTDRQRRPGMSVSQGEAYNLKLSQGRSMAVVAEALNVLDPAHYPEARNFFLEKLSASGRGEQEADNKGGPENNPEFRRVIFRIRVRSGPSRNVAQEIRTGAAS
jgi:outer membrane protein OmpA-like peptidoglycan-associated protein